MYKNNKIIKITFLSITIISPLYAYMDPGTWSYVISFILAFVGGLLFYIKLIWSKIKFFLKKLSLKNLKNENSKRTK